jgi:hypothetical protein
VPSFVAVLRFNTNATYTKVRVNIIAQDGAVVRVMGVPVVGAMSGVGVVGSPQERHQSVAGVSPVLHK